MSLIHRLYHFIMDRFNGSEDGGLQLDRNQQRRRTALLNHIGDVDLFLGQLRRIDHCRSEDEMIDLLAKASILMQLDESFKREFDSLQLSDEITGEGKALLRCVNK
jgi:hypothetical protein